MKPMLLAVALTAQFLVAHGPDSLPPSPVAEFPAVRTTTVTSGLSLQSVRLDRAETDDSLWALGANWKAQIDGRGFSYIPFFGSLAPTTYPLRLELAAATVGGVALELPAIGQRVHFLVDNGSPNTVLLFGEPDTLSLSLLHGCNCILGVRSEFFLAPSSTYWTIPNEPQFVGVQLSVQDANLVGSQGSGYFDRSDTRDFSLL